MEKNETSHDLPVFADAVPLAAKKSILVVDDNQQNRAILCKILGSQGYLTAQAANGLCAFKLLAESKASFSLVLLDLIMPVMDGYTLLQKMNETGIITSVPVIVTTGNEDARSEIRCLEIGASDFLKKPYNPELVLHRVKSLLRLWDNAALIHRLETDHLTGVLSKESFYRHTQELLAAKPDSPFYILYTDIDDFKIINARYGTAVGDELLKFFASNIQSHTGEGALCELCGRVGPDNFAMLLRTSLPCAYEKIVRLSLEKMKDAPVKGVQIKFGVYRVTERNLSASDMCDRAKLAVSSIKHRYGLHYAIYDDALRKTALREHDLANSMEEALEKKQFSVYFQPKHSTENGEISGAEALVRWNHPELGFISPGDFIPLFERNGFIAKLDRYVLCEVCETLQDWMRDGIALIPVSVNLSRADFISENLPERIADIVDSYRLPHRLIHLEITESAYTDRPKLIISAVTTLRNMGFLIEMDDFGSGYSSLNMISELPIDILKLDMQFIQSGDERIKGNKHNILSFILSLSKWLQLSTIAEGVETQEEFDLLKSLGCNMVQGYFFAKPMPAEAFKSYLLSFLETDSLDAQAIAVSQALCEAEEKNDKRPLILVADNVASNREHLQKLLAPHYRVALAANGRQACEYIERHGERIACLVLDLFMPVMDGFKVLEALRANGIKDKISVTITTKTDSDAKLRALWLGLEGFVPKPYQPEILLHYVKRAVYGKLSWDDEQTPKSKKLVQCCTDHETNNQKDGV